MGFLTKIIPNIHANNLAKPSNMRTLIRILYTIVILAITAVNETILNVPDIRLTFGTTSKTLDITSVMNMTLQNNK